MNEPMSEEEYNFLLAEANRQIEEGERRRKEVEQRNFEAFLTEEEIPNYRDAVAYLNMYEDLKARVERRGGKLTDYTTTRRAVACKVALKREAAKKDAIPTN